MVEFAHERHLHPTASTKKDKRTRTAAYMQPIGLYLITDQANPPFQRQPRDGENRTRETNHDDVASDAPLQDPFFASPRPQQG